jgi:hypothetical protein
MKVHESSRPGFIKTKQNRAGAEQSTYRLDGPMGPPPSKNGNGKHKPVEPADEKTRHAAYAALSGELGLSAAHRTALLARGLTDADIDAGKYATLPAADRGKIAFAVLALVKPAGIKPSDLRRVPGFIRRDDVPLALAGRAGLLIPIMDAAGNIGGMVLRPDKPAIDPQGKVLGKYRWLSSSSKDGPSAVCSAHVPPGVSLPTETVRVTEGSLKAAIAQSKTGLPTIGLPGVGMWRLALPALVSLGARSVRLAFDADAAVNPAVAGALARAARGMVAAGFELEVERWDPRCKGIDDHLNVAGAATEVLDGLDAVHHCLDQVRQLGGSADVELDQVVAWTRFYVDRDPPEAKPLFADREVLDGIVRLRDRDPIEFNAVEMLLRKRKLWTVFNGAVKHKKTSPKNVAPTTAADEPYVERDGCTYAVFHDRDGERVEKRIASFTARIVKEITRHEAGETHKHLEVKATHPAGTIAAATIKAEDFEPMAWVASELGSKFVIDPGRGTRDLVRHALQVLSHRERVEYLEVFTTLGWHPINGELVYLHAGGGIGAAGPVAAHVEPEKSLAVYRLPEPDESRLAEAVEQVLALPGHLGTKANPASAIVQSLPYRAVLGPTRYTPHLSGSTGSCKTSTAVLPCRFFAPGLNYDDPMPATWSSTVNGIQRLQYDAGDMVLLIDDLVADGEQGARELYKADQTFTAQGNLGGRRRMKSDGVSLAAVLDTRTCLLSTGECDPRRRSALGRSLIVEFVPDMINFDGLKRCHAAASAGHYAQTIACYVKWLAAPGRLDAQRQELRRLTQICQDMALKHTPGCHPRQAEAVAELAVAFGLFLGFAVEQGVLSADRANESARTVRDHLFGLLAAQADIQTESDDGEMFLELVRSLLASKRAVLSATDGTAPPEDIAGACGWEKTTILTRNGPEDVWQPAPGAARIGWVDTDHAYLDPTVAHAAAERLARESHQVLGAERQIQSRLAETGRIQTDPQTPGDRRRFTRRAVIEKSRRRVLWMLRDEVLTLEPPSPPPQAMDAPSF